MILGCLVFNGAKSLDFNFFTKLPLPPGQDGGGMGNAIVGSAEIVAMATLIGLPVGFLAGIYLAEFGPGTAFAFIVQLCRGLVKRHSLDRHRHLRLDCDCGSAASLFRAHAGSLALSLMLIPITARSTEQFLLEVPRSMREGSLALGAQKWRTIASVIVPAARKGIMTGMILGVARISGESGHLSCVHQPQQSVLE